MAAKTFIGESCRWGLSVTVQEGESQWRLDFEGAGKSPMKLTRAILTEYLGDAEDAERFVHEFKRRVVSKLGSRFELASSAIDTFLRDPYLHRCSACHAWPGNNCQRIGSVVETSLPEGRYQERLAEVALKNPHRDRVETARRAVPS